jgi:predicted TIM-barrel fold metal-dependent hydrolase
MNTDHDSPHPGGVKETGSGGFPIDRRGLLLAAGSTIGLNAAAPFAARAAANSPGARIDAHTHFMPLKFLDFAEKAEGRPFGLSPLLRSRPALVGVQPRIDLLDRNNIDINVLVPVPWIEGFPKVYADPVLATQAARMMNDELAAVVAAHPTRFRGVAILPVADPDAMLAELHRAVTDLGFVGAYAAVSPTAKRMDHPDYEHLYKAIVELDATLWLHPSRPPFFPDFTDEKLSQFYEWQLVGWPYDTTSAMFRIVFSGVFDRYPTIRIVTHHHGAFVPLLAPRLANVWPALEPVGLPMPTTISKPYVEHFRKFYCDTAASGFAPKALELAVDFFGPERVLFGTDAPFDIQDGQIFISETLRSIDAMAISSETRSAILSKNAARILKLT